MSKYKYIVGLEIFALFNYHLFEFKPFTNMFLLWVDNRKDILKGLITIP